jgi:drug/metabolite transporter (DMT)-like permease
MNLERRSSILILCACLLWAVDLLVRYPITLKMSFVSIVFLESMIGLIFVIPFMIKNFSELKQLQKRDWLIAAFIGGIGMTVAGYLQTVCIQKATPGLFSFFQIFQPLFVIYLAHIFLKEKVDNMYVYWGIWVVLSAILMFSVDLEIMFGSAEFILSDILIALGTMLIWGLCTILSKKFLMKNSAMTLVGLRWFFAFIVSSIFLVMKKESIDTEVLFQSDILPRFLFIGVIAGLFSMNLYYSGLKNMSPGKVSFMEISYSAFGMIFSAIYTFEGLTFFQLLGASSFFAFIILFLSRQDSGIAAVRAR